MGAKIKVNTTVVVVCDHALEKSAPLKQSLAIARFNTPHEPAPMPATSRDRSKILDEVEIAQMREPRRNIIIPASITIRLPSRSDNGPYISCDRPKPNK